MLPAYVKRSTSFHSENYQNYSDTNIVFQKLAQIFVEQQNFQSLFSDFHFSQLRNEYTCADDRRLSIFVRTMYCLSSSYVQRSCSMRQNSSRKGSAYLCQREVFFLLWTSNFVSRFPISLSPERAHRATSISAFNISIASWRLYRTTKIIIVMDKGLISREI